MFTEATLMRDRHYQSASSGRDRSYGQSVKTDFEMLKDIDHLKNTIFCVSVRAICL